MNEKEEIWFDIYRNLSSNKETPEEAVKKQLLLERKIKMK